VFELAIYQSEHVPNYWIVDLDARLVERWTPNDGRPEILTEMLRWRPRSEVPELSIDLQRFFRQVLD
jgi:Uma2 family endonuclease